MQRFSTVMPDPVKATRISAAVIAAITAGRLSLTVLPPIGSTKLPIASSLKPSRRAQLAKVARLVFEPIMPI